VGDIEGTHRILSAVNHYLDDVIFDVQYCGDIDHMPQRADQYYVSPEKSFEDVKKADLIIIPSYLEMYDIPYILSLNKPLINFIRRMFEQGADIAAYDSSLLFLAEAGILKDKECTTNWKLADNLRIMYPGIKLVEEKLVTDSDGIYTTGGHYAYLNFLVYLLEKYFDRSLAVSIAKDFGIEINRKFQFTKFTGFKAHQDHIVKKAQIKIEKEYLSKISIADLVSAAGMARRTFERRFKKVTGWTIIEYLQHVKIEAAKHYFEVTDKPIREVIKESGYTDTKAFRTIFKRLTGCTPHEYRNRFNQEIIDEEE
jgi:transcriptional regulator GlxA family with amidase domain